MWCLLMGVAFSLWRAVFLIREKASPDEILQDSIVFLDKIVSDSTISYPQDRNSRGWAAGYYLNNAYSRIDEAIKNLSIEPQPKEFLTFSTAIEESVVSSHREEAWDTAHAALHTALALLERRVRS